MLPITLNFSGKSVRLLTLLDQLKTLPTISVSHDELAKEQTFANRSRAVDDSEEEVCVYKQDGAYIVLSGRRLVDAAWAANKSEFPARLLSKHALKHIQSIAITPPPIEPRLPEERMPVARPKPQQAHLDGGGVRA